MANKSNKDPRIKLGRRGEKCAVRAIRLRGYKLITKNYRTPLGEIDIIARDGETLVFIEVKTRKNNEPIPPEDTVSKKQQRHIHHAAQIYLNKNNLPYETDCRIDIITVTIPAKWWPRPKIKIFKDAFQVDPWR